jgi:hypothetical protein
VAFSLHLRRTSFFVAAIAVAAALGLATLHPAGAASQPCTAAAHAHANDDGALSVAYTLTVECEQSTRVTVTPPGAGTVQHDVEAGHPLVEASQAYLCEGDAPILRLEASSIDWAAWVPLLGVRALPECDVLLRAGVTEVEWSEGRLDLETAFSAAALGEGGATVRSRSGTVPGLSVWSSDPASRWSWTGWGDGVPSALGGLDALEPGSSYLIVSAVERPWTFPEPAEGPSFFDRAQVVSFYGHPGVPVMGRLGSGSPDKIAAEVAKLAAEYDRLNGAREAIPAFHLITHVAQAHIGDGTYLGRLSDERIRAYVEAARRHDMLLFLDVQVGWSDALTEVRQLEEFLAEPFVHIAVDPEFATRRHKEAPGQVIGSLDAGDVNAVQRYLAGIVREHNLPPKILVLHQFLDSMLLNRSGYADHPEVEITIDMDGFGSDRLKLEKYDIYSLQTASERAAIKLFFLWDVPLITPQRLQALGTPPDLVIYQ